MLYTDERADAQTGRCFAGVVKLRCPGLLDGTSALQVCDSVHELGAR